MYLCVDLYPEPKKTLGDTKGESTTKTPGTWSFHELVQDLQTSSTSSSKKKDSNFYWLLWHRGSDGSAPTERRIFLKPLSRTPRLKSLTDPDPDTTNREIARQLDQSQGGFRHHHRPRHHGQRRGPDSLGGTSGTGSHIRW